jgi:hypothetical protein
LYTKTRLNARSAIDNHQLIFYTLVIPLELCNREFDGGIGDIGHLLQLKGGESVHILLELAKHLCTAFHHGRVLIWEGIHIGQIILGSFGQV